MRTVALPLSKEPLWESTGLFLGTLAFPKDEHKARRFALAWCRDGAQRAATDYLGYAQQGAAPVRWLMVRDKEAESLLKKATKALEARQAAYVATQAEFIGALRGGQFAQIGGFGDPVNNTRENAYVKTNVWLRKPAGASTKPLIRDIIAPSRPVIHAAFGLFHSVAAIIEANKRAGNGGSETTKGAYLQNEQHCALMDVLGHPNAFLALLDYVELCRLAAPPILNVTPNALIQFVAG